MNQREVNEQLAALDAEERLLHHMDARSAGETHPQNRERNRKRLAEIVEARAALPAAEEPQPPASVTAAVRLARSTASVQSVVSAQVLITNDGPDDVEVATVIPSIEPRGPTISEWTPPPGKLLKVPAGDARAISFSLVVLRPATHTVSALVRFGDGSQLDAALDTLLVLPLA